MDNIRLNICSLSDPKDPKTWSGTPFNIYSELQKQNRLGKAFASAATPGKLQHKFVRALEKVRYGNTEDIDRSLFRRYLNAEKVKQETKTSDTPLTLHTGTLDLPFYNLPKDQKHYLFCDSTWNLWSSFSTGMKGYSAKLLKDAERMEKKAYQQMEHIFPISEYVKQNLIDHYGISAEKITPVGTGTGVIQPFYGEKNYSNHKVLFAAKGRFEDKGGPLVLEAFKIASAKNPKLELIMVGQNEYTEKIQLPNVTAYGFIPIEQLQDIFNTCSLFLMPAINEPWGLVYLEALACKMPILGLNRNSFPEISQQGKYGFGLDNEDPNALASIILKAFEQRDRLKQMGEDGQKYCLDTFTWEKVVSRIIQTIQAQIR